MALVERQGKVVSVHVPNVTAKTLRPLIVSIDPDFEPDYDYWLGRAEEAVRRESATKPIHKVIIDPDDFIEWSAANGGKIDSQTRAVYAAILLAERERSQRH